jgi:AGZA family xanthine/uracil permease-like MFS transporter
MCGGDPVKPHGKLPWFFTASQALADQLRGGRGRSDDAASFRASHDGWDYQDRLGSKASNQGPDPDRVIIGMPTDPSREKVLRKL